MDAIRRQIPGALIVQTESCEYTHPSCPEVHAPADFHNARRFLPLDLTCGRRVRPDMYQYLHDHGMTRAEYGFFMNREALTGVILGTDYYLTNEHLLKPDGSTSPAGEVFGYYSIARQYYDRYRMPLMYTETNLPDDAAASAWLNKQWLSLLALRQDRIPVCGFTWYSLTDQMDWNTALRDNAGHVEPVDLFDLGRTPREVGHAYSRLIGSWNKEFSWPANQSAISTAA